MGKQIPESGSFRYMAAEDAERFQQHLANDTRSGRGGGLAHYRRRESESPGSD